MSVSIDAVRESARRLAHEASLRLVVLFGSAARGEERVEDMDLALLGTGPLDLVDLTNRFTQAIGFQEIDLVDLRRADALLQMLVARDGIPLYEREPTEFARFVSLAVRRYADTAKFRAMERQELHELIRREGAG